MTKKRTEKRRAQVPYFGQHFDARRSKESHGDPSVLLDNFVNVGMPSESTHLDSLMAIARKSPKPFSVKFLSTKLGETVLPRGNTHYGQVAREIDLIVSNYHSLRWWMTKDGLVVDEVSLELDSLSHFDRVVGPLSLESVKNGRLSQASLDLIAQKLDSEGFTLKEHLQPKEWEAIAAHNQKHTGRLIGGFTSAGKDSRFVRSVRRSIYRARDRYNNALRLDSQIF